MALTGIHVLCCATSVYNNASLTHRLKWSQTMNSPGTTVNAAPEVLGIGFEVSAAVDAFVAVGQAPDPSQAIGADGAARKFVRSGETCNIFCNPGDKLAWAVA